MKNIKQQVACDKCYGLIAPMYKKKSQHEWEREYVLCSKCYEKLENSKGLFEEGLTYLDI